MAIRIFDPRGVREAVVVVALALMASSSSYAEPPGVTAATSPFTDIAGTTFEADIRWLYAEGITKGCSATLFCPNQSVSREQMASFLVRMFELPATATDFFSDDETSGFEVEINRLAAAGITRGCTATRYCPRADVRRDEMASFLARAARLRAGLGRDYFDDDDGSSHEPNIDRVAAAGIATGCAAQSYCPSFIVTRGQMAAFLHRVRVPLPHPLVAIATLFVSPSGSDADNDCLTAASPCRTPRYGLSMVLNGDTLTIAAGTYKDAGLFTGRDVTITGDPAGGTIIDASQQADSEGILSIDPGAIVTLDHLTLMGGLGGNSPTYGGAISNDGVLVISNSTIRDSRAAGCGGAIRNLSGSVTVSNSTISQNVADSCGGGIASFLGSLTVVNSTIAGNVATDDGGGIAAHGTIVTVVNSTISGNTADIGGGIWAGGVSSPLELANTIVAGNAGGNSSIEPATSLGSIVGIPAGLTLADILVPDGLKDNGGATETIALTDSDANPARHNGDWATCAAAPVSGPSQRTRRTPSSAAGLVGSGPTRWSSRIRSSPATAARSTRTSSPGP